MSRFYGDLKGNRGQATRCGTTDSGIGGHIRGWQVGADVDCLAIEEILPDKKTQVDEVRVSRTGGSSRQGRTEYIAIYTQHELNGGLLKELFDALRQAQEGKGDWRGVIDLAVAKIGTIFNS